MGTKRNSTRAEDAGKSAKEVLTKTDTPSSNTEFLLPRLYRKQQKQNNKTLFVNIVGKTKLRLNSQNWRNFPKTQGFCSFFRCRYYKLIKLTFWVSDNLRHIIKTEIKFCLTCMKNQTAEFGKWAEEISERGKFRNAKFFAYILPKFLVDSWHTPVLGRLQAATGRLKEPHYEWQHTTDGWSRLSKQYSSSTLCRAAVSNFLTLRPLI